ncbi:MAG: hypothetical protein H7287_01245 [Thermoleophilia bacterium]|nr:hypothetical protein [Thermoleophilia bacterium]
MSVGATGESHNHDRKYRHHRPAVEKGDSWGFSPNFASQVKKGDYVKNTSGQYVISENRDTWARSRTDDLPASVGVAQAVDGAIDVKGFGAAIMRQPGSGSLPKFILDTNGDAIIDLKHESAFGTYWQHGPWIMPTMLPLLEYADTNKNAKVTADEINTALKSFDVGDPAHAASDDPFNNYAAAGDGKISGAELTAFRAKGFDRAGVLMASAANVNGSRWEDKEFELPNYDM